MLSRTCAFAGCAALAWSTPSWAEDVNAAEHAKTVETAVQSEIDYTVLEPVSDETLVTLRGGESLTLANQTLVAITSGNVINGDYVAGSVTLSDYTLSNFNGLGNVLINTGAQVSLQTGMNLTINVGP